MTLRERERHGAQYWSGKHHGQASSCGNAGGESDIIDINLLIAKKTIYKSRLTLYNG